VKGRQDNAIEPKYVDPRTHEGAVNKEGWRVLIRSTAGEGTHKLGGKSNSDSTLAEARQKWLNTGIKVSNLV